MDEVAELYANSKLQEKESEIAQHKKTHDFLVREGENIVEKHKAEIQKLHYHYQKQIGEWEEKCKSLQLENDDHIQRAEAAEIKELESYEFVHKAKDEIQYLKALNDCLEYRLNAAEDWINKKCLKKDIERYYLKHQTPAPKE